MKFLSVRSYLPAAAACAALWVGAGAMNPALAAEKIVTLGTAGVSGVYYPAGGAICRLVNRNRKEHGVRCVVESTGGSINNLESIRDGDMEMGVVQSNLLYDAYRGEGVFSGDANKKLRVLFSLHSEPFTVVTRRDAKINNFDDLKGKRVNLGNPGSGMRATVEELMKRKDWTYKSFGAVVELKPEEQAHALCSGKIDAMIYAGGHPNGAIQQVTGMCATKIIDVSGPFIEQLLKDHPFYTDAIIPGEMYAGNGKDIHTFGVKAVLVASEDLDANVAYQIVKAVFDNLENFRTLHPVFATLSAEEMAKSAEAIAPYHEGAERYYREKGMLPQ